MRSEPSSAAEPETSAGSGTWREWGALTAAGAMVALLGVLWTLSASRFLSPAELSDFTAAASLIYLAAMALGPLSQATAWLTAVSPEPPGHALRVLQRRIVLLSAVLFIVFAAVAPLLRDVFRFRSVVPLWIAFIAAALLAVSAVRRGFVQGRSRFSVYSASIVFEAILRLALLMAVWLAVPQTSAGLATYPVAALAALLLLRVPDTGGDADLRPLLRYFGFSFAATVVYSLFLNADILLVKLFFPAAEAGFYGAASFIGRAAGMLVAPFYVYAVPHLAAATGITDLRRRFFRLLALFGGFEVIAVAMLALLRRPLVALLLGEGYAGIHDLIVPVSIAVAIGGFTFIACQLPASRGHFRFVPWYAAGFALEVAAVTLWHDTLQQTLLVIIAAQIATLLLVSPWIAAELRTTSRP